MSKLNDLSELLSQKKSKAFYSKRLGISELEVEKLLKQLRYREPLEEEIEDEEESLIHNVEKGTLRATKLVSTEPKTPEDIIKLHNIDTKKWKLSQFWSKQKKDKWLISALFTAIKTSEDIVKQKDIILEEVRNFVTSNTSKAYIPTRNHKTREGHLYEISLFDLHFGKLAHSEEVGQDYDLKIASKRAEVAVEDLLSRVDLGIIDRILFPIGNDLLNVDNSFRTTTGGTPQDCDTRFHKMVKTTVRVMIDQINKLASIAPVDIPVVVGNHDTVTSFMVGEILEAYYHANSKVTINNLASRRKYYQYYENGFQFTHGNEEKITELGMIFAAEQKRLWADTSFRFCQIGHFHKEKQIQFLTKDSFQGFQIEILPSLSGPDAWHNTKGYISNNSAKSFLYHKKDGEVGAFKHTAKL
jgi:hypothetical protein